MTATSLLILIIIISRWQF